MEFNLNSHLNPLNECAAKKGNFFGFFICFHSFKKKIGVNLKENLKMISQSMYTKNKL